MKPIVLFASIGLIAAGASGRVDDPAKSLKSASESPPAATDTGTSTTTAKPSRPVQFDSRLLEIARTYKTYRRVSDMAHWAPWLCSGAPTPEGVQVSQSTDEATHGRKLYFLYAKDEKSYSALGSLPGPSSVVTSGSGPTSSQYKNPVEQVVVKESFYPVEVSPESLRRHFKTAPPPLWIGPPDEQTRGEDGKTYRTGDAAGLFIMLKLDPKTPDTDNGWVYAVTSPDNNKVLDSGRIASCIECHEKTTRDRLFGPAWSRPGPEKQSENRGRAEPVLNRDGDHPQVPDPKR